MTSAGRQDVEHQNSDLQDEGENRSGCAFYDVYGPEVTVIYFYSPMIPHLLSNSTFVVKLFGSEIYPFSAII